MLKLINLKKDDINIEADFIPEDSDKIAHIIMNINSMEYSADEIEGFGKVYARMAANGLISTIEELNGGKIEELPSERLVMWY